MGAAKAAVAVLATIVAFGATAADRYLDDAAGNFIALYDDPCVSTAGVFAVMPDELRKQAKRASVWWENKLYEACYVEREDLVYLVDETGDQGGLDPKAFKQKYGT